MFTDITTVKQAFEARGLDPNVLPDFSMIPEVHRKPLEDHYKMIIVAEALNEGWKPNWNNSDEYKYYPWFDMEDGFVDFDCHGCYTRSFVGSRLCFRSRKVAEHLVAQPEFFELYKSYFIIAP